MGDLVILKQTSVHFFVGLPNNRINFAFVSKAAIAWTNNTTSVLIGKRKLRRKSQGYYAKS